VGLKTRNGKTVQPVNRNKPFVKKSVAAPKKSAGKKIMNGLCGLILNTGGILPLALTASNTSQMALISTAQLNRHPGTIKTIDDNLMTIGSALAFWDKKLGDDSFETVADTVLSLLNLALSKEAIPTSKDGEEQPIIAGFFKTLSNCIYFENGVFPSEGKEISDLCDRYVTFVNDD
jgi:hypothetical protein